MRRLILCLLFFIPISFAWYWPNRAIDPGPDLPGMKFASLSFAPFRNGQSPLLDRFPSPGEADADMARLAPIASAVRSYAALGGGYDDAALAAKHGLKLWQGIWLGADRAKNAIEIKHGIALANAYPGTITRVIVGNEVLLRRDLPPNELIADIDLVRSQVHQPVAYADVWDFWKQFPEVAAHVDLMLIHLLPYWEDNPTGIDEAVAHVDDAYHQMRALFPGKPIAIGETGWPSEGRERRDALPSRLNAARFLRRFIALSQAEHFDYNFIEAFDQGWKYQSEGRVGANWGIFDRTRQLKLTLAGPVSNLPDWPLYAGLSLAAGLVLSLIGRKDRKALPSSALAMGLGCMLGLAAADTLPFLYDDRVIGAGLINLAGQTLLAVRAMQNEGWRAQIDAHATLSRLRLLFRRPHFAGLPGFADLFVLFLAAASVNQVLLASDGRYRDFPFGAYAVPGLLAALRLVAGSGRGQSQASDPEGAFIGIALVLGALASLAAEGPLNHQSLAWNGIALLLGLQLLVRRRAEASA